MCVCKRCGKDIGPVRVCGNLVSREVYDEAVSFAKHCWRDAKNVNDRSGKDIGECVVSRFTNALAYWMNEVDIEKFRKLCSPIR